MFNSCAGPNIGAGEEHRFVYVTEVYGRDNIGEIDWK